LREETIVRITIEIPDELIRTTEPSSAAPAAQTATVAAAEVVLSGGPAPSEFGGVVAAAVPAGPDLSAGPAEQDDAASRSDAAAREDFDGGPAPS
jgi:hypothetical protein